MTTSTLTVTSNLLNLAATNLELTKNVAAKQENQDSSANWFQGINDLTEEDDLELADIDYMIF